LATDAEIRAKSILEGKQFYTLGTPVPTRVAKWLWSQLAKEEVLGDADQIMQAVSAKNGRRDHGPRLRLETFRKILFD
jgi:hypothetical protein